MIPHGKLFVFSVLLAVFCSQCRVAESAESSEIPTKSIRDDKSKALIFCLHDIDGGGRYSLRSSQLLAILKLLKTKYQVVSLREWLYEDTTSKKKVILTFDDGFHSVTKVVIPMLEKFDFGATFFIYLKRHNDRAPFYAALRNLPGKYEIGSHSFSHHNLTQVYKKNKRSFFRELFLSRVKLEYLLKKEVITFAWPYGSYNQRLVDLPEHAGYSLQVSTEYRIAIAGEKIYPRFTLTQPNPVAQAKQYLLYYERALAGKSLR